MTVSKKTFLLIIALHLILIFPASAFSITIKKEQEIAKKFIEQVKAHYIIIEDPEISGYIAGLGEKILSNFPEQPFTYHFYVIKHDTFNAFAGPGGHIFIHSGLFEAMESEAELAGIIGHEISHVSCRHISDRLDLQNKLQLSTIAGIAAGIFLGIYGDPAAGTALTVGAMAGGPALTLAYSRDDEMQADRIGLKYLNMSGYSGQGLVRSLTKIRSRQWFGKDQIPVYMNTHPALEDRMSYISNWVDTNEKEGIFNTENSFDFNLAHAKLTAGYGLISKAKQGFKGQLNKNPEDFFANYGYGIVLSRSGHYKDAVKYLNKALEQRAFHTGILRTLGLVYFQNGDYIKAKNVFAGILSMEPDNFKASLYYSKSLAESGELNKAIDAIKNYAVEEIGKIKAFYCLADIYSRQKRFADSYYYLGLYYAGKADFTNARIQFEMALSKEKDPVKKTKIKTRLDKLKKKKRKKEPSEQQKSGKKPA